MQPVPPTTPPPDLPAAALSTGAVARRLGVSPTTLRSWERRYAIGPARREDGRHRRWTAQDIARLELMCRLTAQGVPPAEAARAAQGTAPAAPAVREEAGRAPGGPNSLPLGEVRPECRGLARAAVRLDAPAVEELLDAALAEHGLVTAWEEVIAPTLHAVGRKWASAGERYVEVEHLLSWYVSSALRRIRTAPGHPHTPPVLLACVPGELHSLPMEALAAALGERGLPVRMFGPALPADALHEAVRRTGPRAVVLWSQSRTTADRPLVRSVAGIEWGLRGARGHSAVLLAGPGWASGPQDPRTERLFGLRSGVDVIAALAAGTTPPATGAARAAPAAYGS
ncbi:MerR family transcriptional regulator [Streptomyces antarcticus]|uniref:MerR family transcriptional regulator n=1 Tax=Streptomyces antarcticus TaxID=2996458 RepID=UPI00226DAF63|nr:MULTISPECIES: MerR family transcriptional regulator [unclassified Streptomyces]MCY0941767.1 MerR family transcriptional regulator [Streptomyces sp. H34-AA3]MCZ4081523.1 MerR family transcriptional regulator [Streptomyces sp. H34-S5]